MGSVTDGLITFGRGFVDILQTGITLGAEDCHGAPLCLAQLCQNVTIFMG